VEELEATAPFIDQRYPDDVALTIRAALTDAELFVSYNMPAKALGPLLSALPKASKDLRLNQRLAALHTRAGRFAEAAVCSRALESVYHDAGYPEEATRYGELAAKYEERTSAKVTEPETLVAAEFPARMEVSAPTLSASAGPAVAKPAAGAAGLFFHAPAASPLERSTPETADFEVQAAPAADKEIDISEEWEGELSEQSAASIPEEAAVEASAVAPAAPAQAASAKAQAQAIEETIEEIRFYLKHSMVEQARTALAKLERLKPSAAMLKAMRAEIETASAQATAATEGVEEISVEEVDAAPAKVEAPRAKSKAGALKEFVADLESSVGEGFLPKTTAREIPAREPAMAESATASATPAGVLGDFVSDLEASLGDNFLPQAPVPEAEFAPEPTPQPVAKKAGKGVAASAQSSRAASPTAAVSTAAAAAAPAPALQSAAASPTFTYQPTKMRPLAPEATAPAPMAEASAGVDLADMFGELKHELEEDTATAEEDPETHYNLGVAFREMGLLDEAIGELQKVCQAVDRGHKFPQLMQTYTWLAQCFLDKGVPEAAIRWYERGLKLAGIDEETRTALHYELAGAYESAGNKPEALSHFMEVYGSNIDYRDVAERMKALKS
jgi:hypothetical protein